MQRYANFNLAEAQKAYGYFAKPVQQLPPESVSTVTDKGNVKGSGVVAYTTSTGKRAWRRVKQGAGYTKRKIGGAARLIGRGASYTWGGTVAAGKRLGQGASYTWQKGSSAAKKVGGVIKANPKTSAGLAIGTAVVGGGAYLLGRRNREG
ncbi:MAG: hypothetical protein ACRDBG_08395 [Waterburya sp.]